MIDLLRPKGHIHTFYVCAHHIARASLGQETTTKRETLANGRKRAVREIREGFQDTTCLRLDLVYKKERKCSWLGRKQLENCLGKQKVNEGN